MPSGVYIRTEYHKNILRLNGNSGRFKSGENHRYWKNGLSKNRAEYTRKRRHRLGISKKYISAPKGSGKGISYTKEYKKLQRQKRKYFEKGGGELPIKRIQLIYEDNIKKYGTLTCYLCLKPIEFRQDSIDHKIPLSRNGTNEYSNLAIAHRSCNSKKNIKTEKEYKKCLTKIRKS